MPWRSYWDFHQKYGRPNQQKGVFREKTSATVHQEQLIKGNRANFKTDEQVKQVYDNATHHNIGIGHGNQAAFRSKITGVREVAPQELTQAVAARAAMKDAINAQVQAEAQA